jgi:hypothetical protein
MPMPLPPIVLYLKGLLADESTADRYTLPRIQMTNRDGVVPDAVFKGNDEHTAAAMRRGPANCDKMA